MSKYTFIEYPKCSTCKNAKKFLMDANIDFDDRNIVEKVPTEKELKSWIKSSGFDVKKFFNTSGLLYKSMNLKDKLAGMTDNEKIELLSSNGMLIKRPILVGDGVILLGFKKDEWEERLS